MILKLLESIGVIFVPILLIMAMTFATIMYLSKPFIQFEKQAINEYKETKENEEKLLQLIEADQ